MSLLLEVPLDHLDQWIVGGEGVEVYRLPLL